MANFNIDWEKEFPDGFISYYGTRHMPKVAHKRLTVLAAIKGTSIEYMLVQCLMKGLDEIEIETYMPEVKKDE